jgi:TolB-like protein/Tfp pilus assembly protein PilF/class 3 adenylate cyclase
MPDEEKTKLRLEIGHVLFIDLVGYSKLLIEEQKERMRELNDIVLATAQVNEATNEKLVRLPTGDGMALVFRNSAEEPAQCALEIAKALKDHPEIEVRMGIHSGPVSEMTDVNGRTNIAGAGINMAQRVMDCGDAGHILLSKHVADDLEQYRQWHPRLHDMGECEVKHGVRVGVINLYTEDLGNRAMPEKFRKAEAATLPAQSPVVRSTKLPLVLGIVSLVALIILAVLFVPKVFRSRDQTARPKTAQSNDSSTTPISAKSIAVLPFENLSRDPDNAYFADGIQDEILTRLAKIADLKVISRSSTQRYKSSGENFSDVGRQLRVAHIVEGSVQKSGDSVRVNVQLIKVADDTHLWAETFDHKLTDIFSVESEVAKAIADQLQAKLTGQEAEVIAAKPTNNTEAYDAYLRGLAYALKAAPMPVDARKYLKQAVELDPNFAVAWALLSYVDSSGYRTVGLPRTEATREEAREAAERALSLQPDLGEGLFAKGFYHYSCLKEYDVAINYFEKARPLLPNSSLIPQSLAYLCRRRGQWQQSESYFKAAGRLDPRNADVLNQYAVLLTITRRFPEALRTIDEVLNIDPESPRSLCEKASIAQAEGDLPRAAELLANHDVKSWGYINEIVTHTLQAIFERRPAKIIPQLNQVLVAPGPYVFVDEVRFWLGWAQEQSGDHTAARQTWQEVVSKLEEKAKAEPENSRHVDYLALTYACLGEKNAALAHARRGMELVPIEKDAFSGPSELEIYARVAALTGETDEAITALQKLLSIPYEGALASGPPLTPALLRLDPMFDPLRNDPRFQKLCQEKQENNAR